MTFLSRLGRPLLPRSPVQTVQLMLALVSIFLHNLCIAGEKLLAIFNFKQSSQNIICLLNISGFRPNIRMQGKHTRSAPRDKQLAHIASYLVAVVKAVKGSSTLQCRHGYCIEKGHLAFCAFSFFFFSICFSSASHWITACWRVMFPRMTSSR